MNKNWTKAVLMAVALTAGSLPAAFAQSTPGQEAPAPAPAAPAAAPAAPAEAPAAPAAVPAAPAAPAEAPPAAPSTPPAAAGPVSKVIYISQSTAYANPGSIPKDVLNECHLPQEGGRLLLTAMRGAGFDAAMDDQAAKGDKGRVLVVEITDVVSARIMLAHTKQVRVRGRLLQDGKEVGSFQGMRSSGGGAFGAYKGSCSVLGRCLETLSKDITAWLRNPGTGNRIGE